MEHIRYFDSIHSNPDRRRNLASEEWTIYDAYESSVATSSPMLNFYKIVNDSEVPKLVELMRKFGIGEFSISFASLTLQKTLMEFCKEYCIITGVIEVPIQNAAQPEEAIPAISLAIHY